MKIADSLRLCALFVHPTPENCGTSWALCAPMMKIADSLRLCALFAHPTPENCGTSWAFCTPMMKIADSLRLCALFARATDYGVVQQAAVGLRRPAVFFWGGLIKRTRLHLHKIVMQTLQRLIKWTCIFYTFIKV